MSIGNPALGEVLAQHGSPHRLLAALAEWGLLVAVRPDRSVVLGTTQAGDRVLLGYTRRAPTHGTAAATRLSACDADTILDIQRVTGVREIVIDAAGPAAAAVPIEDLQRYLLSTRSGPTPALSSATADPDSDGVRDRGDGHRLAPLDGAPEDPGARRAVAAVDPRAPAPPVGADAAGGPRLPAVRPPDPARPAAAISHLLSGYPLVHHVWISEARTSSGAPGIMLHVKVHMSAAEDVVRDIHRGVRARLPQLAASEAPILMARVADARSEQRMIELGAHVVCADVTD